MTRIGKIFKLKSLKIDRAIVVGKAKGEYERLNLAAFVFLYRQFKKKSQGIKDVHLSWETIDDHCVLEIRPTQKGQEAFCKLQKNIYRYYEERLAAFFIWKRSHKEKIRKISFYQVHCFNEQNKAKDVIRVPIDKDYIEEFDKEFSTNSHISLSVWSPHEIKDNFICVTPCYPVEKNWESCDLFFEWTKRVVPPVRPQSDKTIIMQEIIQELGPNFEERMDHVMAALQIRLQEQFSERICLLLEMLSVSLQDFSNLSVEDRLRAISISIFGD